MFRDLIEEVEVHGLLLLLLGLGLGLGSRGSAAITAGSGTAAAATTAAAGTDVGDELLNGLAGEELGEEHGPVGLDGDTSGLDDGVHLVTGHLLTIVGEDERGVGASEVTRHCSARSEDGEVGGQRRVRGRGLR